MSRNLKIAILACECPAPKHKNGRSPWIRLSLKTGSNKQSIADVEPDFTHFPAKGDFGNVTYDYVDLISLPHTLSDTRLCLSLMDKASVMGRVTIKLKPLLRGIETDAWYDIHPKGKVRLILTAIDFGKIDKPKAYVPTSTKGYDKNVYLRTNTSAVDEETRKTVKIRDYKDHEIKRQLPHIASGTYGIVYKGKVKDKKGIVAIKDIKVTDHSLFEEWKREVEFMAGNAAGCPYIVPVYGFQASSKMLTIVMEFAERGMLFDILHGEEAEDLPLLKRVRMARHCALAVAFLHVNKVLHRDIKSLNVLVTHDWVCKLSDFGAAKFIPAAAGRTVEHTMGRGTPLWMAPEVRRGHKYSLPADIFSLGVMLLELFEVDLPDYDAVRQTIVLRTYKFSSAPIVLPCLRLTASARPSAEDVAKQIDYVLGYILTGGDHRVGSGEIVDLDDKESALSDHITVPRFKDAMDLIQSSTIGAPKTKKDSRPRRPSKPSPNFAPSISPLSVSVAENPTRPKPLPAPPGVSRMQDVSVSPAISQHKPKLTRTNSSPNIYRSSSSKSLSSAAREKGSPHYSPRDKSIGEGIEGSRPDSPPPRPPLSTSVAVLLYPLVPQQPGELQVNKGDKLSVLRVKGLWLEGVTSDGRRGWVPENYVMFQNT